MVDRTEVGAGSPRPSRIGPFRVLQRLGAGGMAETFEAVREGPGGFAQRVCIKRVLPRHASDAEHRRLFLREARLAARLSHRNVVRVVELGEHLGCPYLALELADGLDLRRLLRAQPRRRLPAAEARLIGRDIAEALAHAHGQAHPIVHRDVSPGNVLLSREGEVKLTDFGIAKASADGETRSNLMRGNVWYMAPEQIAAGAGYADPRSDVYALGVVLYMALSGRRPYRARTALEAMTAIAEGRRVPLGDVAPDVPPVMVGVVERLLTHDPEARTPSAAAAAEDLDGGGIPLAVRWALADRVGRTLAAERMPTRPTRVDALTLAAARPPPGTIAPPVGAADVEPTRPTRRPAREPGWSRGEE